MISWLTLLAVVAALAWGPVLWRFFGAWRKRRNPVSLAICLAILLVAYASVVCIENGEVDAEWLWGGFFAFDILVCINFYISFWWSERRFEDPRNPKPAV